MRRKGTRKKQKAARYAGLFGRYQEAHPRSNLTLPQFQKAYLGLAANKASLTSIGIGIDRHRDVVSKINDLFTLRSEAETKSIGVSAQVRQRSMEGLFEGKLLAETKRLLSETDLTFAQIGVKVGVARTTVSLINQNNRIRSDAEKQKIAFAASGQSLRVPKKLEDQVVTLLQEKSIVNGKRDFSHSLNGIADRISSIDQKINVIYL